MSTATLPVRARDFTGQKKLRADVSPESTVAELLEGLLDPLHCSPEGPQGDSIVYQLRHTREARHLHPSELVGDALQADDEVMVLPNIQAGGGS